MEPLFTMKETQNDLNQSMIAAERTARVRLSKATQQLRKFLQSGIPSSLDCFESSEVAFEKYHASFVELIAAITGGTVATMTKAMYSTELLSEHASILEKILVDNNVES